VGGLVRKYYGLSCRLFIYFICGLFNDVFSTWDYAASNDKFISEAAAAASEILYRRLLTGTEETSEGRQVGRSPGRELNPGLPEYEATGNT
jgi:hypothetical protein